MAKTKISEYSATAGNNTDINSINLAEGMAPSLVNNAIRQLMAQLKDYQAGTAGDNVTVGGNLAVTGSVNITTDLNVSGRITSTELVTQFISSSIILTKSRRHIFSSPRNALLIPFPCPGRIRAVPCQNL